MALDETPQRLSQEMKHWLSEMLDTASSSLAEDLERLTVAEILGVLDLETRETASFFALERNELTRRRRTHPFWPLTQPRGT